MSAEASVSLVTDENEDEADQENVVELEEDWGEEYNDVVMFLCGLHLNEYVEMFVNQGITLDIFLNLNEEDLCHIGMTDSKHRETLLKGISQLKQNRAKAAEDVQLGNLSQEEASAVMAGAVKHLVTMHAALAHTRRNLRSRNVHNTLVSYTLTSAELLETLCAEADIQAQLVMNQVNAILLKKPGVELKSTKPIWRPILIGVAVVCGISIFVKKIM